MRFVEPSSIEKVEEQIHAVVGEGKAEAQSAVKPSIVMEVFEVEKDMKLSQPCSEASSGSAVPIGSSSCSSSVADGIGFLGDVPAASYGVNVATGPFYSAGSDGVGVGSVASVPGGSVYTVAVPVLVLAVVEPGAVFSISVGASVFLASAGSVSTGSDTLVPAAPGPVADSSVLTVVGSGGASPGSAGCSGFASEGAVPVSFSAVSVSGDVDSSSAAPVFPAGGAVLSASAGLFSSSPPAAYGKSSKKNFNLKKENLKLKKKMTSLEDEKKQDSSYTEKLREIIASLS
ncbi:hypothetical protein ACOSP7_019291 [Xanthoceras sorbifolium]